MPEHRRHARTPLEIRIGYSKLNSFFADYTKNISKGGTFIKTKQPMPVGTQFLFRLALPAPSGGFELAGEVVQVEMAGAGAGMGIRFAWRSEAERTSFEQAVEKLMAESLGPVAAKRLLEVAQGVVRK